MYLRSCQHENGYIDGRSQLKVNTDERTQVHSAQSSLVVTHPSTNRARRYVTSVTEHALIARPRFQVVLCTLSTNKLLIMGKFHRDLSNDVFDYSY